MDMDIKQYKKNTIISKDDIIYFLITKLSDVLSVNTNVKSSVYEKIFLKKLESLNILNIPINYREKNNILSQFIQDEFSNIIHKKTTSTQLQEFISKGEDTTIFKMYNQLDGCIYAIKKMLWNACSHEKLKEIKLMAKLHHPNIVRYHTAWIESDLSFSNQNTNTIHPVSKDIIIEREREHKLVDKKIDKYIMVQMELCQYNLKEHLELNGKITVKEKLDICCQIAKGLRYIHEKQVVHMDIKPENVLFGFDKKFKISDFGLSFYMSHEYKKIKEDDEIGGTIGFVAPEILSDDSFTIKSDIYSLGMTFLYIFIAPSTMMEFFALAQQFKNNKFQVESKEMNTLIQKMLSKSYKDRPSLHDIIIKLNLLLTSRQTENLLCESIQYPLVLQK